MAASNKDARLFIRVSDDERAKLQTAANARGLTLSAYVRMVALDAAKKERK